MGVFDPVSTFNVADSRQNHRMIGDMGVGFEIEPCQRAIPLHC